MFSPNQFSPNQFRRFTLLACLLTLLAGCADQSEETEVRLPDWLSETGDAASASASQTDGSTPAADAGGDAPAAFSTAGTSAGASAGGAPLQPGARFPLRKVVEQQLKQSSLDGTPHVSRSRRELLLNLTVAEVRDAHTLMQVHYERVVYSHDVAGEQVAYDSARPPQTIPPAALAYHTMVGDGFAFWLGPDNQIVEVVGFREFVERCLEHVPPPQRQQALQAIEASAGPQGVADFVDGTIGLLPRDTDQLASGRWEQTRHITQPVPMQINTTYTLTGMNDQTAEVTIGGTIVPSTTIGANDPQSSPVHLHVNGGSTSGQCTIDRSSGLPRNAQIERIVDMTVQMDGGIEFAQQKRTLTTIEALPQQRLATHNTRPQFR